MSERSVEGKSRRGKRLLHVEALGENRDSTNSEKLCKRKDLEKQTGGHLGVHRRFHAGKKKTPEREKFLWCLHRKNGGDCTKVAKQSR